MFSFFRKWLVYLCVLVGCEPSSGNIPTTLLPSLPKASYHINITESLWAAVIPFIDGKSEVKVDQKICLRSVVGEQQSINSGPGLSDSSEQFSDAPGIQS